MQEVISKHIAIAKEISRNHHFSSLGKIIYRYSNDRGIYLPDGEEYIAKEAQGLLEGMASSYYVNEVIHWIERETQTKLNEFDKDSNMINTLNYLINTKTLQVNSHVPEYQSMVQIPVYYRPNADCLQIRKFLSEILKPEDIPVIEELIGYCLLRQYHIQKAFLFVGEGSNGKSTLIELMRIFLGRDNCASLTFQELEEDRFARADLYMKLANLSSDIPSKPVSHVGKFKMLTGGDETSADRKFRDRIKFVSFAKLIFSANRPPKVYNEDSFAFWRRWIIIEFPNQFTETADKQLLSKLTSDHELSGLLNLALKGLARLQKNGQFSYSVSIDEIAERYNTLADPVLAFVNERCEIDYNATVEKDILFQAFLEYCKARKIPLISKESFGRNLRNSPSLKIGTTRIDHDGQRLYAYKGIKLKEESS